jgi:peroxiredoxin
MKYFICIIIFSLSILKDIFAASFVSGNIDCCKGESISLLIYDNFIINTQKEIARTQIDSAGNFQLPYAVSEIHFAILKVKYIRKSFYIEPGKQYKLIISSIEKLSAEQLNSPNASDFISLSVKDDEFNNKYGEFNYEYNTFIISHSFELTSRGGQKKIDELEKKLNLQFGGFSNHYFQQSLFYKIASLKLMTNYYGNKKFAELYFINKPVLYGHVDYMDVFNQYFHQYFKNFFLENKEGLSLKVMLNNGDEHNEISNLLKQDSTLKSDTLLELVMLKGLFELYFEKDYNKHNIIKLIHYIEAYGLNKNHKSIAEGMGNLLLSSTQATDFNLYDIDGKKHSLKGLKGKYVYLNFWKSDIPESTMDFDLMKDYYDVCKGEIEFVSICADDKFEKMKFYLQQHSYPWPFVYYENNFQLLEVYKVVSYPSYVLINPQGYIIDYSAPRPSENLSNLLTKILDEMK